VTAPARWWHAEDGAVRCELCPHGCRIVAGRRGACGVRENRDGRLVSLVSGAGSGFADPIEKKPLFHFLPGSKILSIGTVGCTLKCRFCQNWSISQEGDPARLTPLRPEEVPPAALAASCRSVAFTYNEPAVFAEYALEIAAQCRTTGLKTVAVSAGYFQPAAARELVRRWRAGTALHA